MSKAGKPVSSPSKASKTRRVWEIAGSLSERTGRRAERKAVIDAYVEEGGNPNTASTQYAYWKQAYDADRADRPKMPGTVAATRLTVGKDGRLLIPARMRDAMLLGADEAVSAEVVDGELRILSAKAAVRHVQAMAKRLDKGSGSAVDELIAERREEAQRESRSK